MPSRASAAITPSAARLTESLRDIGYDFPAAVADLVDNSIMAGAARVDIADRVRRGGLAGLGRRRRPRHDRQRADRGAALRHPPHLCARRSRPVRAGAENRFAVAVPLGDGGDAQLGQREPYSGPDARS